MPIIGTDEVRDIVCMVCALQNIDALRIKGMWKDQIQWDLLRQTSTSCNNEWEAGSGSLEAGTIHSADEKKVYDSTSPTARRCFSIFMLGEKWIMGVMRSQDKTLTVD